MPRALRFDVEDLDTVARTVYGEARGESWLGQSAVAWVIRTRASRPGWWGRDARGVCLAPKQFSCWNDDDPNRAIIDAASFDHPGFLRAWAVSTAVLLGDVEDPTHGADHYHALTIRAPGWTHAMQHTADVGLHRFYRGLPEGA